MIFGHLLDLTISDAIDATVTDVDQVGAAFDEEQGDEGRSHPAIARISLGGLIDAQVRKLHADDEAVLFIFARLVHLVWPGRLRVLTRRAKKISERLDGHLARNFTRSVSSHAVCDDVEILFFEDGEVVFVVGPLEADVGLASLLDGDDFCCQGLLSNP